MCRTENAKEKGSGSSSVMFEDELIENLASLNINGGRSLKPGNIRTPTAPNNKGEAG